MIHQFSLEGFHITVDVYSGAVHVTDKEGMEAIRLCENLSKKEAEKVLLVKGFDAKSTRQILEQIEGLKKEGQLYAPDMFEQNTPCFQKRQGEIKALCLHVAHTCNLICSYCFAAQGRFHGQSALMPFEVAKKAIDFLLKNSGKRRHLEVDFFGGEPLLSMDVVKQTVSYARSKEKEFGKVFRFTITTNGMLLDDELTEYFNQEMDNVVLSLDGRKEVHDRFRVDAFGKGSYDVIVPKFQRFVEKRGDRSYYIRGTFTHHNPDFFEDIRHMVDLGFRELSMEPVVTSPGDPSALTKDDMPIVFESYEKLAKYLIDLNKAGKPVRFYHFNLDLENGPCLYKRIVGCGSGSEYLAVTPWGDLYPCHQFVGEKTYKMGSLDEGITRPDLQKEFLEINLFSHPECKDCWAKFYCSGGCAANNVRASGSLQGIYKEGCDIFRKRMECALMMQAAMDEEN